MKMIRVTAHPAAESPFNLNMAFSGVKTPLSAIFERSRNLEENQTTGAGSTAHNQRVGNLAPHHR